MTRAKHKKEPKKCTVYIKEYINYLDMNPRAEVIYQQHIWLWYIWNNLQFIQHIYIIYNLYNNEIDILVYDHLAAIT